MSEFVDHALNKKGECFSVGDLVQVNDHPYRFEYRRIKAIEKEGSTFRLTLDNNTYVGIEYVIPVYEPPPTPDRFVRFETTTGPIYFDLEQVVAVIQPSGETVRLLLSNGQVVDLNHTFKSNITKIMDGWIAHQNDRWKKDQTR